MKILPEELKFRTNAPDWSLCGEWFLEDHSLGFDSLLPMNVNLMDS